MIHGKAVHAQRVLNGGGLTTKEISVRIFNELFTTDVGLMSAAGIAFMLGMAVFFIRYFRRHIREDTEAAARAPR